VILKPETWPAWLGEEPADSTQLSSAKRVCEGSGYNAQWG
jgi:hypothetical protein